MKYPYIILSFMLVTCFLLTPACNNDDDAKPENMLRIGVLIPITGSASSAGESISAAISLALDDVNDYLQSIGSPLDIELIIKDTGTDAAVTQQKLQELEDEGIQYVIGPYASANAAAVLDDANTKGIFLLSPSSVATSLAIDNDNLYRLAPSDKNQAAAIAALFAHDGITTVITVVRNDVWGNGLLADAGAVLSAQGVTMHAPIMFDPVNVNSADIASQVASAIGMQSGQTPIEQIGVYLMSFGEGTDILASASAESGNALVKWYGSSAFANNGDLLTNSAGRTFAQEQEIRCPSFAPDPAAMDLLEPIKAALEAQLGRTPEVYALTSYDALWVMTLAFLLCNDPYDLEQFKSSFEYVTSYYNGITGRMTLDAAGDRKFASFNFWGIEQDGGQYDWKSFGYYNNATGQLVIY